MVYKFICNDLSENFCASLEVPNEEQLCNWATMADQLPFNETLLYVPFCDIITAGVPINIFLQDRLKGD